jgi:PAS domain S-box-containing protein
MTPSLSFAEYRLIVEQAPIMIWRSNITGGCDYFNDTWLAFTGRTVEQELGDGWTQGVHEQDLDRCMATYRAAFGRRETFSMEYRLRRHDGVYRWIQDCGATSADPEGQFSGYVGSCLDISDRVEAQEVLRKAQEDEVKNLKRLLPICAACKKIRDDQGYWDQVEVYLRKHSELAFTHSICPECRTSLYPGLKRKNDSEP